jgi:hypothetical protein
MDWSKAKPDVVQHVVKEGQSYLDAQLHLGTSADQRASVLAGIFIAAATGVLLGLASLAAAKTSSAAHMFPVFLGGLVTALLLLSAGSLCVAATMPVKFWLPGNEPESWFRDVKDETETTTALGEEAEHIQAKIVENRMVTERNARRFKWGAMLGIAAPFVGTLFWVLTSFCRWLGA